MAISIRNPRVEQLAREIGEKENISMTQAILEALEEKRARMGEPEAVVEMRKKKVLKLLERVKNLPVLDDRSADEILGYNEWGGFD